MSAGACSVYGGIRLQLSPSVGNVYTGIFSEVMLPDTFTGGLHLVSLKRDTKRYIRKDANLTFADVTRKALRWMREDSCSETTTEQIAVPLHDGLQQLQQQTNSEAMPKPRNDHGLPSDRRPTNNSGLCDLDCRW